MTPLKSSWVQLIDPMVEHMKLQAHEAHVTLAFIQFN